MNRPHTTRPGRHIPPGASADGNGVNFSILARDAVAVELRLYDDEASGAPAQVISLDAEIHRTFFFWHVYVERLRPGAAYTWRVIRPGQSLDRAPELLDPWARAVSAERWQRQAACEGRLPGNSLLAIVTSPLERSVSAPTHELDDAVIYELHVGGFTRHPSASVAHPGTFKGLIEKIPYLKELGVTHVELLPVMAFDAQDVPRSAAALGLENYWGYSTCGFYAPHPAYCIDHAQAPFEFQQCVQALHDAGLHLILDVVFNHTAEGGADGPAINFKELADEVFYHHEPGDPARYRDYTGCGNTVNCSHPLVTNFIVNCLEYWALELGVDGFRFDLASVFARGVDGEVLDDPPLPWAIELSRVLVDRTLIAEAWDAAGLYHVGRFPGMRWAEWNGRYRDVMRRFVRGEAGLVGEVATRLAGSSDFYSEHRLPSSGVNFITCHDGFTLADLVSYDTKHNEANGEANRDGSSDNLSWNCGVEGESDDPGVVELRRRQARNLMVLLFLSQGVPMILAGDEVLSTQRGNNNAYCQNNENSWFDWDLVEGNRDMLRFVKELIALRKRHPSLRRRRFLTGRIASGHTLPDVAWHGARLNEPPWLDPEARLLSFTLAGAEQEESPLHVILNMESAVRTVDVPKLAGHRFRVAVDTSAQSPADITPPEGQIEVEADRYAVPARTVVVLEAERR